VVFWGLVICVVVAALSAGLCVLVNKLLPNRGETTDNEAIGFIFCVVGVLYAIVLAFVLIDVWTKFTAAGDSAAAEATALVEEYRYAQTLPDPQRIEIQRLARDYATQVIGTEWSRMDRRENVGLEGYGILDELRGAVQDSRPVAPGPSDSMVTEAAGPSAWSFAVSQGDLLAQSRDQRITAATQGIPSVVWFVLIGGMILSIGQAYVFQVGGVVTQMFLTVGLTVMTALILWSVFQLEYPFSRQLNVGPDAFEFAVARFAQITGQ
jgi:hypothetical protein